MKSNQRAHQKLVGGSRGRISTSIHTHTHTHAHTYVCVCSGLAEKCGRMCGAVWFTNSPVYSSQCTYIVKL